MGSTHYQTTKYTALIFLGTPCYLEKGKNKQFYWAKSAYKSKYIFLPDANDSKYGIQKNKVLELLDKTAKAQKNKDIKSFRKFYNDLIHLAKKFKK